MTQASNALNSDTCGCLPRSLRFFLRQIVWNHGPFESLTCRRLRNVVKTCVERGSHFCLVSAQVLGAQLTELKRVRAVAQYMYKELQMVPWTLTANYLKRHGISASPVRQVKPSKALVRCLPALCVYLLLYTRNVMHANYGFVRRRWCLLWRR